MKLMSDRLHWSSMGVALILPLLLTGCGNDNDAHDGPSMEERVAELENTAKAVRDNAQYIGTLDQRVKSNDSTLKELRDQLSAASETLENQHGDDVTSRLDDLDQKVQQLISDNSTTQSRIATVNREQRQLASSVRSLRYQRAATAQGKKPAAPPKPSFSALGIEERGGRTFLAVAEKAGSDSALKDVQLLQEGDSIGSWRLERMTPNGGVFAVNGQHVTVTSQE
ncbi:hypothetical protein [Carnimonas bestiolae]|uniref:hypothetical protein n=1 Tax=Carnimonas bestiolae TaxID=3402172 RepID=UPI003EDC6FF1